MIVQNFNINGFHDQNTDFFFNFKYKKMSDI